MSSRPHLQWGLPSCRGNWCRDCFNVWRLLYSAVCTLVAFAMWLKKPENALDYEMNFVSYLSLRSEGIERISESVLACRRSSLEFAMRMLSVPCGPFQVVRFKDMDLNQMQVEASRLVTFQDLRAKKCELAYLVSWSSQSSGIDVRRPLDHTWLGMASRAMLHTGDQQDVDMLQDTFPEDQLGGDDGELVAVVSPDKPLSAKVDDKLDKKTSGQIAWAQQILNHFDGQQWHGLKESSFTSTIAKLMQLKAEAACSATDQAVSKLDS